MSTGPSAYPLTWPRGFPRMPGPRQKGAYRTELGTAVRNLQKQLEALGGQACGRSLVVSSNVTLTDPNPRDPGAVAYFTWEGKPLAIPCDRWASVQANVQAIALTIEAMRAMERHGAKEMISAMFSGFLALPPPEDWRAVLRLPPDADMVAAEESYRRLSHAAHPDRPGGSHDAMARLNGAIADARKALGA